MKKEKKYLKFYEECIEKGSMDKQGLCNNFRLDTLLPLFEPESETEYPPLMSLNSRYCHWAFDGESNPTDVPSSLEFTELRQTIVLFMAAMNEEL